MTTPAVDRRRLLGPDDFRADLAEAESFLLASQPPRPTPSKEQQRELDELQARLDEAAVSRDAALAARMRAGRAAQEAYEAERARQQEGQGFVGLANWLTGGKKIPSLATAKAALEEAEKRFLEAEAVQDRARRDLTSAEARVRAAAERLGSVA